MGALFWRGSMRISMKIRSHRRRRSALGRRCLFTLDVQRGTQRKGQEPWALVAPACRKDSLHRRRVVQPGRRPDRIRGGDPRRYLGSAPR